MPPRGFGWSSLHSLDYSDIHPLWTKCRCVPGTVCVARIQKSNQNLGLLQEPAVSLWATTHVQLTHNVRGVRVGQGGLPRRGVKRVYLQPGRDGSQAQDSFFPCLCTESSTSYSAGAGPSAIPHPYNSCQWSLKLENHPSPLQHGLRQDSGWLALLHLSLWSCGLIVQFQFLPQGPFSFSAQL